jgi:hypothetical protein
MITTTQRYSLLLPLGLLLGLAGCTTPPNLPEVTADGLVRVKDAGADAVYVRTEAQLGGYTKVALVEPTIAFRKDWLSNVNSSRRMDRITDQDMQKMIATGKKMLVEEFTKELTKGGYQVVTEVGANVLAVRIAIMNLDVYAPDPSNMAGAWTKIYTDGSGEATLGLELYDSVTGQLLLRAYDHKSDSNGGYSWRIPRTQNSNLLDARWAFQDWAEMLVKGLNRAKAAPRP